MKSFNKKQLLTGVDNIKYVWKHNKPYALINITLYLALIAFYAFLISRNPTVFTITLNTLTAISMGIFFLFITARTGNNIRMHHQYTRELREILDEIHNMGPIPHFEPTEAYLLFRGTPEEDLPDENF